VEKVRQWNRLHGNALRAGRSLTIFKTASDPAVDRTAVASSHRRLRTSEAKAEPEHTAHPATKSGSKGKGRRKNTAEAPAAKSPKAKDLAKASHSSKKHKQRG
jgi:hypothetical protein